MSRKRKSVPFRILDEFPANIKCSFCLRSTADPGIFGEIYQISTFTLHYLCLLSASDLLQRGRDNEGLLGYLTLDIETEICNGKKRICSYCEKTGASVRCHKPNCQLIFHLPCGVENGSLQEYYDQFRSFCKKHAAKQEVPESLRTIKEFVCLICLDKVKLRVDQYLWLTCCKIGLLHKTCCQKFALNAGGRIKCPLCNNVKEFYTNSQKFGIFIPKHEAVYEVEASRESNYLVCMASFGDNKCLCSRGPLYSKSKDKRWQIKACCYCGNGMHLGCMTKKLQVKDKYVCEVCEKVYQGTVSLSHQAFPCSQATDTPGPSTSSQGAAHEDENKIENKPDTSNE